MLKVTGLVRKLTTATSQSFLRRLVRCQFHESLCSEHLSLQKPIRQVAQDGFRDRFIPKPINMGASLFHSPDAVWNRLLHSGITSEFPNRKEHEVQGVSRGKVLENPFCEMLSACPRKDTPVCNLDGEPYLTI